MEPMTMIGSSWSLVGAMVACIIGSLALTKTPRPETLNQNSIYPRSYIRRPALQLASGLDANPFQGLLDAISPQPPISHEEGTGLRLELWAPGMGGWDVLGLGCKV